MPRAVGSWRYLSEPDLFAYPVLKPTYLVGGVGFAPRLMTITRPDLLVDPVVPRRLRKVDE